MSHPLAQFGEIFEPEEALEPILTPATRALLTEWLEEIWAEEDLLAVGLKSRKKAIFDGAPGVGKTTLAHHLAARLGLPMIAVRTDCIISKWMGETGENIGKLFRAAADPDNPVLIFIDEFDALAQQRKASEHGADDARNEKVDTLLQRLEQHKGFLIAATNFADQIDQAIWRRFDIHITLDLPGPRERERILARYLLPFGIEAPALAALAEAMETASPALMRAFCEGLKRQIVIGPKLNSDMRRDAVIDRIIGTIHPHAKAGKPRLWSHGARDASVRLLGWPLRMASEIGSDAVPAAAGGEAAANVVRFGGGGK